MGPVDFLLSRLANHLVIEQEQNEVVERIADIMSKASYSSWTLALYGANYDFASAQIFLINFFHNATTDRLDFLFGQEVIESDFASDSKEFESEMDNKIQKLRLENDFIVIEKVEYTEMTKFFIRYTGKKGGELKLIDNTISHVTLKKIVEQALEKIDIKQAKK